MQKKIWKKSICAVLSTLLVLSSATSFTAFAADEETDAAPSAEEFFSSEQEFNFDESDPMVSRADLGASDDDSIWYFGEDIYIWRGRHEIVRRSLDSGEEETIYTDSEVLDEVFLEPRLAYIMKKDTIYRLYIPTRQLEPVFTDSALERFYPISNLKIGVYLTNPEWTRYLEETGDTENEHGIPERFEYIVNLATGEKTEVIGYGGEETDAIFPRLSYGSYTSGTYFTKNGSACNAANGKKCHSAGVCTWDANSVNASKCNCKIYDGAIQCLGYAKYVYAQNNSKKWGSATSYTYKTDKEDEKKQAEAGLKKFVEGLKTGSHIRIDSKHSVIVTSTGVTGFNTIEANADGASCKVTTRLHRYSDIVEKGQTISQGVVIAPCDSVHKKENL